MSVKLGKPWHSGGWPRVASLVALAATELRANPAAGWAPAEAVRAGWFAGLPLWGHWLMALSAAFLWWAVHRVATRPTSRLRGPRSVIAGGLLGFVALSAALNALQFHLVYTTRWPLWIPAAAGALAVEACTILYAVERRLVRQPAVRRVMFGCRIALALLLAFMLAQPVMVFERSRVIDRHVAILLDETPSMALADTRMSIRERLRLAETLGLPHSARPYRIDAVITELARIRDQLATQSEWLESLHGLAEDERAEQLEGERKRVHQHLRDCNRRLRDALTLLATAREAAQSFDGPHTDLTNLEARLDQIVLSPLTELAEKTRPESMPARWLRHFRERGQRQTDSTDAPPDPQTADASNDDDDDAAAAGGAADADAGVATNGTNRVEIAMTTLYDRARQSFSEAIETLDHLEAPLRTVSQQMDDAFYRHLDDSQKEAIDQVTRTARVSLARDLLLGVADAETEAARTGFLTRLQKNHPIKLYRLTGVLEPIDPDPWRQAVISNRVAAATPDPVGIAASPTNPPPPAPEATGPDPHSDPTPAEPESMAAAVFRDLIAREAELIEQGGQTDWRLALEQLALDIPSEQLDAVIMVSDARHNADGAVEPTAARFGARNVPLHTVLFGASNAPIDAAIVSVHAPDTLLLGDRARFAVEVRLDGMTNRPVNVHLLNGTERVDTQVAVAEFDGERRRVDLTDQPDRIGQHTYRIEVDFDVDEAVATNNVTTVSVNVTEDPAYLLLIEGRPTWEFRYLKNLFAGRDPWTRLQYVLLDPRLIPGEPEREIVPAAVARTGGETPEIEATALPESIDEWLKFDVVILGDVAPSRFRDADWDALTVFVKERGGTLIVLAGPLAMPHAYESGPLRDLLPVHPLRTERALMLGPERDYQIRLTAEGELNPIMRLAADPEENLAMWAGLPPIHWRQSVVRIREAATVLAFAAPPDMPPPMQSPATDVQTLAQQREYQHARPLIVHHHAGLGNVMVLAFNHTWRMRYRTGDTFHHRFWGQVMRWATAYKMPFGTDFIRLGTGQARYAPGDPVRIRARLLQRDYAPLLVNDVTAVVRRGEEPATRHRLHYIEGSPGIYETELATLEAGRYTVSLEAPADPELMRLFNQQIEETPPSFAIESGLGPEWLDVTPDPGLAGRLAALSGGQRLEPATLDTVLETLGPARIVRVERDQWDLWNSWPMLSLLALLAGIEWFFRKRERLP